ncbi:MAG: CBS domain-containing protein [Opitutaceae bacterium]|nr:CBS domain-containing protein [Opitutaceae bacterium]
MKTSVSVLLERKGASVQTISPDKTVADAVRMMNDLKISSVVVAENDKLVGIFTERDVLRRVVGDGRDPQATPMREVMSTGIATLTPESTIEDALGTFADKVCRHLPVMAGDKLAGMISVGDVTRWMTEMHRAEAEQLKNYISGGFPT